MFKRKYVFRILLILTFLTLLSVLGFIHDNRIHKKTQILCLEGQLALGRVISVYEPFRKERVDFEIEYEVNGETYIEKCSNGKYLFYWDDLIWVLYNKDNPESSQAFYQIAEQYEYKGKYTEELDMAKRYEEMDAYIDQCKCIPDSLTEVSYYGFLRYFGGEE
jgi:hypothetical protein